MVIGLRAKIGAHEERAVVKPISGVVCEATAHETDVAEITNGVYVVKNVRKNI